MDEADYEQQEFDPGLSLLGSSDFPVIQATWESLKFTSSKKRLR